MTASDISLPAGAGSPESAPGLPSVLDELRATEYGYLDDAGHVYLDYTGAGLAARSQLRAHAARIASGCYGNPHSENPTSSASTELVEEARARVLRYFNTTADDYTVIFTPNATGACRLVGESYPFRPGSRYVLTADNHNSINGIREFARRGGARVTYVPISGAELRVSDADVAAALSGKWAGAGRKIGWPGGRSGPGRRGRAGLFAYPAQSNFTGVRHSLDWVRRAQDAGYDVLLDAAAFVPTNVLDLSAVRPEFVPVSWYKVFGYPTGVGSLLVRRDALPRLRRPWFSGGTILGVSVQGGWHQMLEDESAFEDGTLNFLSIPDVTTGIDWIDGIGLDQIHRRVSMLTGRLLDMLGGLRHDNGAPLARLYGPVTTSDRGGTIAFNFLDPAGRIVDERAVARDASAAGISLRTGCFCNPGAGEWAFGLSRNDVAGPWWSRPVTSRFYRKGITTVDDYLDRIGLPSGGAVRVSVGVASTIADIEAFRGFAERTYRDREPALGGLAPRLRC
ncbi:MAG TPA: aminotransferase class V-fold PLP-dependent enzyme [Trebonia sp.]